MLLRRAVELSKQSPKNISLPNFENNVEEFEKLLLSSSLEMEVYEDRYEEVGSTISDLHSKSYK